MRVGGTRSQAKPLRPRCPRLTKRASHRQKQIATAAGASERASAWISEGRSTSDRAISCTGSSPRPPCWTLPRSAPTHAPTPARADSPRPSVSTARFPDAEDNRRPTPPLEMPALAVDGQNSLSGLTARSARPASRHHRSRPLRRRGATRPTCRRAAPLPHHHVNQRLSGCCNWTAAAGHPASRGAQGSLLSETLRARLSRNGRSSPIT